jgi:hypothetical protein
MRHHPVGMWNTEAEEYMALGTFTKQRQVKIQ